MPKPGFRAPQRKRHICGRSHGLWKLIDQQRPVPSSLAVVLYARRMQPVFRRQLISLNWMLVRAGAS